MESELYNSRLENLFRIYKKFRAPKFRNYVAIPGKADDELTMDHAQLRQWCESLRDAYDRNALLNCIQDIDAILSKLVAISTLDVRDLSKAANPVPSNRSAVSFRLDVDAGIWSMAALARSLAKRGIPACFFLLHTASYYGAFSRNGVFVRQPGFPPYLADLVATGQEIGIHNDALKVFSLGIDGIGALNSEIRWLRRHGASVRASAAHNSAPVYGAENFEIFEGLCLADRPQLKLGEWIIPLGTVSAQALGLVFEANHAQPANEADPDTRSDFFGLSVTDPIRNPIWLRLYFLENPYFTRNYDTDIWLVGYNSWVVACRRNNQLRFPVTHEGVIEYLERSRDERIVFNIHPDYVAL